MCVICITKFRPLQVLQNTFHQHRYNPVTFNFTGTTIQYIADSVYIKRATAITGLRGPEGSGRLRLQITRHSAHEGVRIITLTHRPSLPPGISWYSFLEAESTPGHMEMSAATEYIPSVTPRNRSRVFTTFSAVP